MPQAEHAVTVIPFGDHGRLIRTENHLLLQDGDGHTVIFDREDEPALLRAIAAALEDINKGGA